MTRPRMAGAASSCRVELTPAAKVTVAKPSGTRATRATGSVGAMAARRAKTPKPSAAPTSSRSLTRPRAPVASAPATDPIAIATASAV